MEKTSRRVGCERRTMPSFLFALVAMNDAQKFPFQSQGRVYLQINSANRRSGSQMCILSLFKDEVVVAVMT